MSGFSPAAYSYATVTRMTNNYQIGTGGFGDVYRGRDHSRSGDTTMVAVKKHASVVGGQGAREFQRELDTLQNCQHANIVTLLGSCSEPNKPLCLVYKYMPGGSLADRLLTSASVPLSGSARIAIAHGIATGLQYLHTP